MLLVWVTSGLFAGPCDTESLRVNYYSRGIKHTNEKIACTTGAFGARGELKKRKTCTPKAPVVHVFFACFSLGAVLVKRQGGFGKHKPQIWSGPYPCFDKDGAMKFPPPKDPPWFTDDKCHLSVCLGGFVLTKSTCALKGAACPAGQYLAVVPKPSSPADCCVCKPYEPL